MLHFCAIHLVECDVIEDQKLKDIINITLRIRFLVRLHNLALIRGLPTLDFLPAGMKQDRVYPCTGIRLWC